jgi:plastocyanin
VPVLLAHRLRQQRRRRHRPAGNLQHQIATVLLSAKALAKAGHSSFTGFDSGSIDPEKSWRHTFTEAGELPYFCTFQPEMKAAVVVK